MTAVCERMDPDMWSPESDSARLALLICGRCQGCPDNDPTPHGVIRQGVAYSDAGQPLPICPSCGFPVVGYRGGTPVCGRCAAPDVAIPDRRAHRLAMVSWLTKLDTSDALIAAELGVHPQSVHKLRKAAAGRDSTSISEREAA